MTDETIVNGPARVLAAFGMRSREEVAEERAAANKAAALADFREDLAHAYRRSGLEVPTVFDVAMRFAAGAALEDRDAEKRRSERLAEREATVAELELAGYRGRTLQEAFDDYGRACAIADARAAREAANARAAKAGGPVPWPEPVLAPMQATRSSAVGDGGVIERARARVARHQGRGQASHVSGH